MHPSQFNPSRNEDQRTTSILSLHFPYKSTGEKLLAYQENSPLVIIALILTETFLNKTKNLPIIRRKIVMLPALQLLVTSIHLTCLFSVLMLVGLNVIPIFELVTD